MGEVYRAKDTRLDRTVAIKVLPEHLSDHPELKQRFEREAKTISSLQHPNICALHDIGHENGIDFLVMEYLEGETLADRLKQGPVEPDNLLEYGVQITEALDRAHKSGIVHRDLKPGNIMITREGVKLLDFGLAKAAESGSVSSSSLTQMATEAQQSDPLTQQGTVLGTFQYMSPEQLEGGESDPRSDIFALGAVLYEMATGRKAFEGKSQASLIASIMSSSPPAISTIQPMTPPALDRVIGTCLEKDPEDRWQTAHDVALQLKWIEEGGSQAGIPKPVASRRRSRERSAWIVAAFAGVVALTLAALHFMSADPESPQLIRFNIQPPSGVTSFGSPRISPDGRYVAFNGVDSTGTTSLWVRPLNSLTAYPFPDTRGCSRPFWSPDSRFVAFFAAGKLKKVPVSGGPPFTICEFPTGADCSWGASGMILFDARAGDSLHVVSAGGGIPAPATTFGPDEVTHGWPHFLPDGEHFVFVAYKAGITGGTLRLGTLGSIETTELTAADSRIEYIHPGHLIYEHNGALLAHPFDADARKFAGDPFPLADGIGVIGTGLAHFSGSQNGVIIYHQGDPDESRLVWVDRKGYEVGAVSDEADYSDPALSPDERRVAVEIYNSASDILDLWVIDLERGVRSRFTFDDADDFSAVWSPDGKRIAFGSQRLSRRAGLFIKNASGTGSADSLGSSAGFDAPTDWSPDGRRLFSTAFRAGQQGDVVVFPADGESEEVEFLATPFLEAQSRISPDGRYLAYTSNETGRLEVYVTTYPDGEGKWQVSSEGAAEPMWRGDGRELFFLRLDRRMFAVDVDMSDGIEFGRPKSLFLAPIAAGFNTRNHYSVSKDGQRFLLVSPIGSGTAPPTTVVINWWAELENQ